MDVDAAPLADAAAPDAAAGASDLQLDALREWLASVSADIRADAKHAACNTHMLHFQRSQRQRGYPVGYTAETVFGTTDVDAINRLSEEEFLVTRKGATERAFTGRYWDTKAAGTYRCICCGLPLFRSDAKFDSGCGWPSFCEPLEGANLLEVEDDGHGMIRTEIRCKRCDAHLGHVFPDGPPPTGNRYCINSVSLDLEEDGGS